MPLPETLDAALGKIDDAITAMHDARDAIAALDVEIQTEANAEAVTTAAAEPAAEAPKSADTPAEPVGETAPAAATDDPGHPDVTGQPAPE